MFDELWLLLLQDLRMRGTCIFEIPRSKECLDLSFSRAYGEIETWLLKSVLLQVLKCNSSAKKSSLLQVTNSTSKVIKLRFPSNTHVVSSIRAHTKTIDKFLEFHKRRAPYNKILNKFGMYCNYFPCLGLVRCLSWIPPRTNQGNK